MRAAMVEFAAARRTRQDEAIAILTPLVAAALDNYAEEDWWRPLLAPTRVLFNDVLAEDSGGDVRRDVRAWSRLSAMIADALPRTGKPTEHTALTIATWLSTASINWAATTAADHSGEPMVMEWVTMHDAKVRHAHADTDGQQRLVGEPFDVDGTAMAFPGDTRAPIELWINCVVGSTQVAWPGQDVQASTRRLHHGEFIEVTTALGHHLTVTPNHPVLTTFGYVPAGDLSPGDDVIASGTVPPQVDDGPASIEQVHGAALEFGSTARVRGSRVDFHGDGAAAEVEVVWTDRDLAGPVGTQGGDGFLVRSGELSGLPGPSEVGAVAQPSGQAPLRVSAGGFVGGGSERAAFGGGQSGHPQPIGLRAGAPGQAQFVQSSGDQGAADAEVVRHTKDALALGMTPCEVVKVERYTGSHEVYNLHTSGNWYTANGITVHNCRCAVTALPVGSTGELVASAPNTDTSAVIVALPAPGDPVWDLSADGDPHLTLVYLGTAEDNPDLNLEEIRAGVTTMAGPLEPFAADVKAIEPLGDDGATVWMLDPDSAAVDAHAALLQHPAIGAAYAAIKQYPQYAPHVTVGYDLALSGDGMDALSSVQQITFDRLALWAGDDRQEYPLSEETDMAEVAAALDDTETQAPAVPLAWHAVLAPEGVWSGDGRMFNPDSLRYRDLPLPFTWQRASDDGHKGSVVIAKIESIERAGNLIRAEGHFIDGPEADEAVGLIAEFGRFGVSIDADDAEFEFNDEDGKVAFSSARIASASMVAIPAFAEAFIALGTWADDAPPADAQVSGPPSPVMEECDPEAPDYEDCIARQRESANLIAEFGRGPGWLTNPADTKRIHDYWTKPGKPGYIKVGWGTGGDFARCKAMVGEEIGENSPDKLRFLNQICAQWHHDATGFWPGKAPAERVAEHGLDGQAAPAVSLIAAGVAPAPAAWFANPNLDGPTPLTVTDDGRVFGHLAAWTSCHIGYPEVCVAPPSSSSDYAYFLTGEVVTTDGRVPTGPVTIGAGHAPHGLSARKAIAHYDSTSTVVADVTCGNDEHGIWCAGMIRPGASDEQVYALRASGWSGDWREIGVNADLELIAAHAVNTPGFPIPRVGVRDGVQVSLVAAGALGPAKPGIAASAGEFDVEAFADAVAASLEARALRRELMARLVERVGSI